MAVPAGPGVLPEPHELLSTFQVRFLRPKGREGPERYTTGLLTESPDQNDDTMALPVPWLSAQRLQEVLSKM